MDVRKWTIELWVSLTALTLSVIATVTSIYFSQASLRTSVQPTLVFVLSGDSGWSIRNVGSGPALNVVLAVEPDSGAGWQRPTQLYPIPAGERVRLPWVGLNPDRLGAVYSDAHNRAYTSIVDDDITEIMPGSRLRQWPRSDVRRDWQTRD